MEYSINLLGNSQTFFGVIATVIILSILKVESNFIFEILKKIKDCIVEKIQYNKPKVSFDSVKDIGDYKAVLYYQKSTNMNPELALQCANLCMKLNEAKMEFQTKLLNWDKDASVLAEIIEDKNEQQMAPMFLFAYTIVVFVVDELLRCSLITCNNFILVSFTLFSSFVFLFWLVRWLIFLLKDEIALTDKDSHRNRVCRMNSIVQYGVFFLTLSILLLVSKSVLAIFEINAAMPQLLLILCLYLFMGLLHVDRQKKRKEGQMYLHYVEHFLLMIVLSIFVTAILIWSSPETIDYLDICNPTRIFYIKVLLFTNALCYGLVFPFILPLVKYSCLYLKSVIKTWIIRIRAWYKRKMLLKDFKKMAMQVPGE